METTTITPVETELSKSPLTEFQTAALEAAEKELESLKTEIENQKYLVDLKKDDLVSLNTFVAKDAPWKFTEALGIIEVRKETSKAVKDGKLFTNALTIEALYYYLSKVEGKGETVTGESFKTVDSYISVMKGIISALEKTKADNEKIRQAEFTVAARREGIDVDSTSEQKN